MTVPKTNQLLLEAKNTKVIVELENGQSYVGILKQADYNMNLELINVELNKKEKMDHIYIRGNQVKLIKFEDDLAKSPMFKNLKE